MARENVYQTKLIAKLKDILPGCIILKNDASYLQGVPDLIVLWGMFWAMLEVKKTSCSSSQPNQEYWVDQLNEMSFAAFICPENEEDVLYELQRSFGLIR